MKVSKAREPLFRLRDEVGEGWFRVLHLHSLEGIPRRDAESDTIFTDDLGNCFDDFEWEPCTVLNGSTVLVGPLVGDVPKELIREVTVGEVKFDSIESGLVDCFVGSISVPLDVGFDFIDGQRTRSWVRRGDGNCGCADEFKVGIFGFKRFNVCGATKSPKLEEDVRAICVYCIYDLRDRED